MARERFDNPWKFDFFQAVLLLQQVAGEGRDGTAAPVGRFSLPSKEAMRFGVPNSLALGTPLNTEIADDAVFAGTV